MARLTRLCPAGVPLHVIQRGNNRQVCFVCEEDYHSYLGFLHDGAITCGVEIHAWVLMTNHVHLLATSHHEGSISRMMQYLGRYYVRYYNQLHHRTGTLWEGRFKSCIVDTDRYFLACQRYIELNPVRAGIVSDPGCYRWSSYRCNALGEMSAIVNPSDVYLSLGPSPDCRHAAYRELFEDELNTSLIIELREATQKNLAFGSDAFKEQVELLFERRVRPKRPGPKGK